MKKGQLIKKIVGEVLEPEGFVWIEPKEAVWKFHKKTRNSKGEKVNLMVQLYNSNLEKKIYMDLISSAGGHTGGYRIDRIVPGCKTQAIYYTNDEEYKQAIEKYASILKEYGIPLLRQMIESLWPDYLSQEDHEIFYQEHEQHLNSFMEREKIDLNQLNIEMVAEFIEKHISEKKSTPFEEVKPLIMELAAVFGYVANRHRACKWILKDVELRTFCALKFLEPPEDGMSSMTVLDTIFSGWRIENLRTKKYLLDNYNRVFAYEERELLRKYLAQQNQRK